MFTERSRKNLFRFVCVPVRLLIASVLLYAIETHTDAKLVAQIYLFATAFVLSINILRTELGTKVLGGFGGVVWWNELRYVHVTIYTVTGILVTLDVRYGSSLLFLDVVVGALASIWLQ